MNTGLHLRSTTHWSLISQHFSERHGLKLQITSGIRENRLSIPVKIKKLKSAATLKAVGGRVGATQRIHGTKVLNVQLESFYFSFSLSSST